jgi:hypothetical protein
MRRKAALRAGVVVALVGAVAVALVAPAAGEPANVALAWSPSGSIDYGTLDAARGQTASQTFTLSNADRRNSGVVEVALSGSSTFAITADGCSGKRLTRRKSCSVTVTYAPTANGNHSATLVASSPIAESASVALTGKSAWQQGDLVTYDQNDWGDGTSAAGSLLAANFDSIFPADLVVGDAITARFTSATAVFNYLPASGVIGPLTNNSTDPTTTSSGEFGGHVVALTINVEFSDADLLANTTALGDLRICDFNVISAVNGMTVRQFLTLANFILGGGTGAEIDADEASAVAFLINNSFVGGSPSTFAQDHLQPGPCP